MKKLVSGVLIFSMLFTLLIPIQAFAGQSKELEQVINIAKSKITIPDNLTEFNYGMNDYDGTLTWSLSWTGKEDNGGNLNINIKQDGTITSYYCYKPYDSTVDYGKFPKVSIEKAKDIALDFIKKVRPEIVNQIKLDQNNNQNTMDTNYNFNYYRVENNIPLRSNNISININSFDGTVQSYNSNWTENLTIPSSDKAISLEKAQAAFKEKLGLQLVYDYKADNKSITTYPVFKQKYDNYYINALTGEKVELGDSHYGPYYERDQSMSANKNDKLTPQEQKAVDEASNTLSKEEAEKIVRGTKALELTDEYKLDNANLYKDYMPTGNILWNLSFVKKINENDYNYIYAQINAKSGQVTSFNISSPNKSSEKSKYNETEAKAKVEMFLNDFCKSNFNQTVYDENYQQQIRPLLSSIQVEEPENKSDYTFRYFRKVNGIPFLGNYIVVRFDAVNDKVVGFELAWFDTKFAPADSFISVEKAYDKLFGAVGYQLEYKFKYNNEIYQKYMGDPKNKTKPEVFLVYTVNPIIPARIDAKNGQILDNNGDIYKDNKKVDYTDIEESNAKEQINTLAKYGVKFDGDKFLPSKEITQKEFLYLLSKAINQYDKFDINNRKDVDRMYSNLINSGIIKKSEKVKTAKVKKEDGIKFLIRALKYDKVADLKDIYACDFLDKDNIKPELVGYIAIAKGLKIIQDDNGYINPKVNLTREQAAVVIYNYLNR